MGAFSKLVGASLIVGAGVVAVGALVAGPSILRAARPAAREGLKCGMLTYRRARKAASDLVEDVEDLVAEVQSELKHGNSEPAEEGGADQPDPAPGS